MGLRLHGHRYEAIGGETHRGVRGSRHADTSRRRRLLRASVPCGAVFCLLGLWMAVRSKTAPEEAAGYLTQQQGHLYELGSESRTEGREAGEGGLGADVLMQVLVTNKYQRYDDSVGLYPWEHVAEPVRETRLEILSWPGKDDREGFEYMYVTSQRERETER